METDGYRVWDFFGGENEKVLKLIVAMVAQLCECTESH